MPLQLVTSLRAFSSGYNGGHLKQHISPHIKAWRM